MSNLPAPLSNVPPAPLHPLSSIILIATDALWGMAELTASATLFGLPAVPVMMAISGVSCGVAVTLIEKFLSREDWGAALAKGVALGVLSGLPYPVMGTLAGTALLGWSGAYALGQRQQAGGALPPPTEKKDD